MSSMGRKRNVWRKRNVKIKKQLGQLNNSCAQVPTTRQTLPRDPTRMLIKASALVTFFKYCVSYGCWTRSFARKQDRFSSSSEKRIAIAQDIKACATTLQLMPDNKSLSEPPLRKRHMATTANDLEKWRGKRTPVAWLTVLESFDTTSIRHLGWAARKALETNVHNNVFHALWKTKCNEGNKACFFHLLNT